MSDLSVLDASGQTGASSVLDASSIDANLKAIKSVEAGWRMPALPDMVSLDLASQPGVTSSSIASLLYGLDSDFAPEEQQTVPLYQAPALPEFSSYDRLRTVVSGVASSKAPTVVTGDAIQRWKMNAIDSGYLDAPEDGVIDNSWSSDFESIRKSMSYDDYNQRMRGDRPGAVPFSKVVEQIGKWTSPSGLLAAATDLDLWWDPGAISKEVTTWGDKWRKVGKSDNPFEFAKNLVDAITGPIDDIVMPIANWALLASGVGEAWNFGRIAYAGKNALAGAEAVEGLYRSSGFLNFVTRGYDAAADVKRMKEAGWIATKLGKSSNAAVSGIGDTMKAWRNLEHVAPAKKFLATGMKLGIASQAEDLIPGYQGGGSFRDNKTVAEAVTWAQTNPLIVVGSGVAELFFTPYSTFRPGTFIGGTKNAIGFVGRHLGSTSGKAVAGALLGAGGGTVLGDDAGDILKGAAFGAMGLAAAPGIGKGLATIAHLADETTLTAKLMPKAVGHVGDFLQRTSWKAMAGNQHLTMAFHEGMLETLASDTTALAAYQKKFDEQGFLGAFAQHFGVDEEAAGASMAYASMAAAIDHVAASQAGGKHFGDLYHLSRNKMIAQIHSFDLENIGAHTLDEIAMSASRGINGEAKEFASLRKRWETDPGPALEHANAHNRMAQETIQQLLSVESIPDLDPDVAVGIFKWNNIDAAERVGIIKAYMPQVMDTFGNWPQFTSRTDEIRSLLHEGLLDDAVFDTYKLPSGLELPTVKPKPVRESLPTTSQEISQEINNLVFRTPETDILKVTSKGKLGVLARGVDPSQGRHTIMRLANADKGEVLSIQGELSELLAVHKTASERIQFLTEATTAHGELTALTKAQFSAVVESMVKGTTSQKATRRLWEYAKREGMSLSDARRVLDETMDKAVNDPRLTEWLGLSTTLRGKPVKGEILGAVLRGPEALKARIGEVTRKAKFTAARIDGEKLLASTAEKYGEGSAEFLKVQNHLDSLERDGYKLVHGVEFMMPQDLAHHTPIFADINRRHLNAASLGNAFKGRLPAVARAAEERRSLLVLQDEFAKIGKDVSLDDQVLLNVREDAMAILRSEQAISEQARDAVAGAGWLKKRLVGLTSGVTPMSLADLGRTNWNTVVNTLEPVYGKDVATAVAKGLRRMRNTEFKDVGLYAIEAHMRTNNQVAGALKVLSGTKHGESFMAHGATGRKVGFAAGAIYGANQEGDNNLADALKYGAIGAAAGTVLQGGLSPLFQKAEKAFEASDWFRYGYLADNLAALRDTMRFTMSPFFDISRYTEGQMLGHTAAPLRNPAGERIVMPNSMSPRALKKTWAKADPSLTKVEVDARFKHLVSEFNAAARGETDFNAADNMSAWFQQVGIVGFNPTHWMATAFHHLTKEGFDPREAYELARDMHTYGTKGRSAVEQSVNFIFFPFSFQKKAMGHIAKFVSDDMSRAIVLHDALKGYELLNEKFNLSQMWRDHLPVLEKLQQLNMFAYGLSPGRFGGINRPFIEPIMNMAANAHGRNEFFPGILNFFNPQGISVKSATEAADYQKMMRSLTPVLNDINHFLGDSKEQVHALTSPSRQTFAADAGDGWREWNEYRTEFRSTLERQGFKMTDLQKPWMAATNMAYKAKQAEIAAKYPGWGESRKKSAAKSATQQMELSDRFNRAVSGQGSQVDVMTYEFDQAVKAAKANMKMHGVDDIADMDQGLHQQLLDMAAGMAANNQEFRRVYAKFYQRELGLIEAEVLF